MTNDPQHAASPGYALGRLHRAVQTAANHPDAETRRRATAKIVQWQSVLQGMSDGTLRVGSRTPVADTPAWVTLEVAHGGFATGRYLAEGPLLPHEQARLSDLPDDVRGSTDRERLNHWYLSDAGQAELLGALREGRLHVSVPEEGALPVVAWLLEHGDTVAALELVTQLQPLMHRLRLHPALRDVSRTSGAMVRLRTVGDVQASLAAVRPQRRVHAMNESLGVWAPLYDRLVALWLRTVEGEAPRLVRDAHGELVRGPNDAPQIEGGWPCRTWPSDWATHRQAWLDDYRRAAASHSRCDQHTNPKRGFARLRELLVRCPEDSRDLGGRDVARLRATLAGTITRHGVPGSEQRQTLRAEQAAIVARPSFVELAAIVVDRLASEPADGGLLALEPDWPFFSGPVLTVREACLLGADRKHLYVTNWGSRSVSVIDVEKGRRIRDITVGIRPNDLVLAPDGRLFVATAPKCPLFDDWPENLMADLLTWKNDAKKLKLTTKEVDAYSVVEKLKKARADGFKDYKSFYEKWR